MKRKSTVVPAERKTELSFHEQELLKGAFDALCVSPGRVEETIAQAKAQSQRKEPR